MNVTLTCIKDYEEEFKKNNQYTAQVLGDMVHIYLDPANFAKFTRYKTAQYFIDSVEHREEQLNKILDY